MSAYIAFDLDALNVARDVGNACGLEEAYVTHGMLRMWSWCFRTKTDSVNGEHVRGFFGADATAALIAFGFLTPDGSAFKVRGAERYLRLSEARKKGGLAAKKHLIPGAIHKKTQPKDLPKGQPKISPRPAEEQPKSVLGSAWALSPNTKHLLPNTVLNTSAPNSAETPKSHKFPDWQAAVDAVCLEFQKMRGAKFDPGGRNASALKKLEARSSGNLDEVLRRWRIALQSTHPRIGELYQLEDRWNQFSESGATKASNDTDIIGSGEIIARVVQL